jgi:hypothetical protein
MDLRMHIGVLWRWRVVAACGLALAIVLTFFSFFRVSLAQGFSVTPREGQTWGSTESLLLSQGGIYFEGSPSSAVAPTWLTTLSSLYAQIANSDIIRAQVFPGGHATSATGDYLASPVSAANQSALPVLEFDGTGGTPQQAINVTRAAATTFLSYLNNQSNRANVPSASRVDIQVISSASPNDTQLIKGRKLTIPIVIFLAVSIATIGLIYLLENFKPQLAQTSGTTERHIVPVGVRNRTGSSSSAL